jgi:dienelactone hydrolase
MVKETRAEEMKAKVIELDGKRMKFEMLDFPGKDEGKSENKPKGRALFISMHGGGGAPPQVNESQWRNQIKLGKGYNPAEGIYLAPRAPTDTWNLWHEGHIDTFFDRIIQNLVVMANVNPNRVYILGYSAGGDGVYQLAPRMADRWAAASMMAGHPNETSPVGLRNVPFALQVGGEDAAYKRNQIGAEWGKKLDELQKADPKGYEHMVEIHAGKPHWMDMEDRKAIPWMEKYTRNPLPEKIVWRQDDRLHLRQFWLGVPKEVAAAGQEITAERKGQTFTLSSATAKTITVMLNDALADLDQPVIKSADKELFSGKPTRTIATLAKTLSERGDPDLIFPATQTVTLP